MRRLLANIHWFIGITLGAVLAFSGVTGALMAFGPELTDWAAGGGAFVDGGSSAVALSPAQLYARIQPAVPGRRIVDITTWADPRRPARVRIDVPGFMGPTSPVPEIRMANPYSGELLPARPAGQRIAFFMHWLHEVHQGHVGGPRDAAPRYAAFAVGLASLSLLVMALSGLYLRWPRGRAARSWRAWLRVDVRLRGRAFLWNLHTVVGTVVLLAYVLSAHSGAFQSGPMSWYGNGMRAMLGLAPMPHAPGPPPAGPPGAPPRLPDRPVRLIAMAPDGFFDADYDAVHASIARLDPATGIATPEAEPAPARGPGAWLGANNQLLHEGRVFGRAGTAVIALASLAMPLFYVTGWMMYLKRRRRA